MKERRITKPQHVRQVIGEQINVLRREDIDKIGIEKARAIGYLSSVALTAMRDGDLEERLTAMEQREMERELNSE